jgi:hypothetical protein
MIDPCSFFENGRMTCGRCRQVNDLGSNEALYRASESTRCGHCGFLFVRHCLRQMAKLREMLETDAGWTELLRAGRNPEVKRRLDMLVPAKDDETSGFGGNPDEP